MIWTPETKVYAPDSGRLLFPGQRGFDEAYEMSRIGTPGSMSGGMGALSGVDTRLLGANVWVPALAGYVLFLDGDQGVFSDTGGTTPAVNGGAVKRWNDQSGNGHNLSENSGTNRIYTTNALNGHSVVAVPTAANDWTVSFTLTQPCTFFVVGKWTWDGSGTFFQGDSGQCVLLCQGATVGDLRRFAGTGVHVSGIGYADNTYLLFALTWNGASSQLRVNNNSASTQNPGAGNPSGFYIAQVAMKPSIAAVLVYPSALSTSDETIVRNDINTRFAIF